MQALIQGKQFEVAPEPADFWGWVSEGRYDAEWKILNEHLLPEHTFLDLGAWVGSHSLYASRISHRVIAVEPDPVAYKIFEANTKDVENIRSFPIAILGHEGEVKMGSGFLGASTTRINPEAGGGIGAWEQGHTFITACTTLRRFVEDRKIEDPFFIKMDVEGAEEEILKDVDFFREHKPVLYLETHPWWWKDEAHTRKQIELVSEFAKVICH